MSERESPKRRRLTEQEREELAHMHEGGATIRAMARTFGVCSDTLKRILVREGLADYEGAKFSVSASSLEQTWTRPCSRCGCTKPRPKNHYRCEVCKAREVGGLPDNWMSFLCELVE
jgi:hypothetical protein